MMEADSQIYISKASAASFSDIRLSTSDSGVVSGHVYPDDGRATISMILVPEASRQKGIATKLAQAFVLEALKRNATYVVMYPIPIAALGLNKRIFGDRLEITSSDKQYSFHEGEELLKSGIPIMNAATLEGINTAGWEEPIVDEF